MKIEKVNDNQIRCTLTKEDLASRELKISELAYGTEKAKSLFRDMMQQANYEFGFEAEDIPLMIEAIPMNAECIVLIITKVEDPEELDTRFSRFAPSLQDEEDSDISDEETMREDVLDLFKRIHAEEHDTASSEKESEVTSFDKNEGPAVKETPKFLIRLFQFDSLHAVMQLAVRIGSLPNCSNTLYKNSQENKYYLLAVHSSESPENFNRLCNIASEYAMLKRVLPSTPAYLEEHYEILLANNALQVLSSIGR